MLGTYSRPAILLGLDAAVRPVWILATSADRRLGLKVGTIDKACRARKFPGKLLPQYRTAEGDLGGLFGAPLVWWVKLAAVQEYERRQQERMAAGATPTEEPEPDETTLLTAADVREIRRRRAKLDAGHSFNAAA